MKNLSYFILVLIIVGLSACFSEKNDTMYYFNVINLSPNKLLLSWESKTGKEQKLMGAYGEANSSVFIYGEDHEDAGNLGSWNEEQFKTAIQSVHVQRISIQGDTLDPLPLDFSDFKYWRLDYSKPNFMGDVEHLHQYTLNCTDSLLNQ